MGSRTVFWAQRIYRPGYQITLLTEDGAVRLDVLGVVGMANRKWREAYLRGLLSDGRIEAYHMPLSGPGAKRSNIKIGEPYSFELSFPDARSKSRRRMLGPIIAVSITETETS